VQADDDDDDDDDVCNMYVCMYVGLCMYVCLCIFFPFVWWRRNTQIAKSYEILL